jgi:hypothetical protein
MKKSLVLIFLVILMCSSLASAGIFKNSFSFLTNGHFATGYDVAEIKEGEAVEP